MTRRPPTTETRSVLRTILSAGVLAVLLLACTGTAAGATWIVDDDGSADFVSIQAAVDAAGVGDTIEVRSGTYVENVYVDKRLTLRGEGADVVTVQAADVGDHVFEVTYADYVNISEFTVTGAASSQKAGIHLINANHCNISDNIASSNCYGIWLYDSTNSTLQDNIANSNNWYGIYLEGLSNNTLTNNTASNNNYGIFLRRSSNNTLQSNTMSGNKYNFGVSFSDYTQNIDTSNTVDGKPIYYWVDQKDKQIPDDAGFVGVVNSENITVKNLTLTNNYCGVLFAYTKNSMIENVTASNNVNGIELQHSSDNTIANNTVNSSIWYGIGIKLYHVSNNNNLTGNTASNNNYGISMLWRYDNTIYHNNLIDNTNYNAYDDSGTNQWDNGAEGNYYSDYTGTDSDGDGIGDTSHPIPGGSSVDRYPLMAPWTAAPLSGKIAFASFRDGNQEVYVMNADGNGDQIDLTNRPDADDGDPTWSPDGKQIAFSSNRDGNWKIYVMNADDGSDQVCLLEDVHNAWGPAWSPDGKKIAVACKINPSDDFEIYTVDIQSKALTPVTDNTYTDSHPSWSPDSHKIVFTSDRDGNQEIYVADLLTGTQTRLTDEPLNDDYPEWSPDGSMIAFVSERDGNPEIYSMNIASKAITRLTHSDSIDKHAQWSPDGQNIVFISDRDGGDMDVYVMKADGTGITCLVDWEGEETHPTWSSGHSFPPAYAVGEGAPDPTIEQHFIDAYNRNGGLNVLGSPTTEVHEAWDYLVQDFPGTSEYAGGIIMYNPDETSAYYIHGAIWDRYYNLGGPIAETDEEFLLGIPTSDVLPYVHTQSPESSPYGTPFRYQNFSSETERAALVHNLTSWEVFEIHGAIYATWSAMGYVNNIIGLVTSDEREAVPSFKGTTGRVNDFENGHLHWHSSGEHEGVTYVTYGELDGLYVSMSGTASWLGFPVMDQEEMDGYGYCEFEGGYIEWDGSEYKAKSGTIPTTGVTIIAPTGGEDWQASTIQTIQWTYTGELGPEVEIEILKDGWVDWRSIVPIGNSGHGSYEWKIEQTQTPGDDYQVRITSTIDSIYTDTSDHFTISEPSTLLSVEITSPNKEDQIIEDEDATFSSQVSGGVPPYKYEWTINTVDILSNLQNFDINFYGHYGDDIKEFHPSGLVFFDLIVTDANGVWGSDDTYVYVVPPEPEVNVEVWQNYEKMGKYILEKEYPYEIRVKVTNTDDNPHYYSLKLQTPPENDILTNMEWKWNANPKTEIIKNDMQTKLIQPGSTRIYFYEFKSDWDWIPPQSKMNIVWDAAWGKFHSEMAKLIDPKLAISLTITKITEIVADSKIGIPIVDFKFKPDEIYTTPTLQGPDSYVEVPLYVGQTKVQFYQLYLLDRFGSMLGFLFHPICGVGHIINSAFSYTKAFDPVPDYTEVVQPEPFDVPEINSLPDGLYKKAAQETFEMLSYSRAEEISYIRYAGAVEDNASDYALLQLEAVKKYNSICLEKIETLNNIYKLIVLDEEPLTDEQIEEFKNKISNGGLPSDAVSILTREGLEDEIPGIVQMILDADPDLYRDPSLIIDYNNLNGKLRSNLSNEYIREITEIRVNQLGQSVSDATPSDIEEIEILKGDIQSGLNKGYATQELRDNIQSMLNLANALVIKTNNNNYLHYYSFATDAWVKYLSLPMPYKVSFLPPITITDQFNLTDGSTLPIGLTARDNDTGEFIYDDTVNITITNSPGSIITNFNTTNGVQIDSDLEQYTVDFNTMDYPELTIGETHTIQVTFGDVSSLRGFAIAHFTLVDRTPPSTITNPHPTAAPTWLNWTWTNPPDPDFNHTEIYLNGAFQTITSAEYFNATDLTPETSYTISTRTVDTAGNINQTWANDTATTLSAGDTIPPTIESVTLDAYTTIPDATIHATVNATDNAGVTSVTADGVSLAETGSIWEGDITAPSTTGGYTLTIIAEDVAGNAAEATADYSVVIPTGGLGTAILPKISSAPAGSTLPLDIKIVSTENFDEILHVYLTLDGIPTDYQADLGWFNWTDTTVQAPAGGEIMLPIAVDIPDGASPGYKSFGVKVESTKWRSDAQDYGAIMVT